MTQFTYRKKPVVVEAFQFHKEKFYSDVTQILPFWFITALSEGTILEYGDGLLVIKTLEGDHFVSDKDWIIKGTKDELYPCKPDIFSEIYEAVE